MKTRIHASFIALILLLTFVLPGCAKTEASMPGIVFMYKVMFSRYYFHDDTDRYGIGFYDKDGNFFTCDDPNVYSLSFDELIKEYELGNLTEKINSYSTCDKTELSENYRKLCELAANKNFELTCPDSLPDVVPSTITSCYGLYYDKSGEIQSIRISHEEIPQVTYQPNDDRAAEISEWVFHAFKKEEPTSSPQ